MVNQLFGAGRRDPRVLDLLGDPARRKIVALLAEAPRKPADLARELRVSRPAISRHLRLLRTGGLIEEQRGAEGRRSRVCRLHTAPLTDAVEWLQAVQQFWATQLSAFNQYVAAQAGASGPGPRRPQRGGRHR